MSFLRIKKVLFFLLVCCCAVSFASGKDVSGGKKLHSQYVARTFHDIGFEILKTRGVSDEMVEQAMAFLIAASELDRQSKYINETILNASPLLGDEKYDKWIFRSFVEYCNGDADLDVAGEAISHFLEGHNSREERQKVLSALLSKAGVRNAMLSSDLSTRLALLAAETGDFSRTSEARTYFKSAVLDDRYNSQAFSGLDEIYAEAGEAMQPSVYARHLRLFMTSNPMDIGSALRFADYAENIGMHDVASQAYEYIMKLHKHLNGNQAFDSSIYIPWALSSYHSKFHQGKCLEILNAARGAGIFDIMLESIAGKAAFKMSNKALGERILASASRAAEDRSKSSSPISYNASDLQVAWFYSFVSPDSTKAIAWANRAYSNDPDSTDVKAILSYAMAVGSVSKEEVKRRLETARGLLTDGQEPLCQVNQIAAVAMALVELRESNSTAAEKFLLLAVEMDAYSFAAERAKALLKDLGQEYKADNISDDVVKTLDLIFPNGIVPKFARPEDLISTKIALANADITFGVEPEAKLIVSNNWTEPMVIFDKGLFKGNIRVDAEIRGDIKANIYELVSKKIRPSSPISGGGHISIPLKLMTGSLRRILHAYPQASVEVKFTVYLDPVVDRAGNVTSSVKGVAPLVKNLKRRGVALDNKFLMQSLRDLSKGRFKQKVRSGRLFTGLFSEQYTNTDSESNYRFIPVDRSLVTSAIRKNLLDDDWMVKTVGISLLLDFRPPMDFEITRVVSQNLNDPNWPVRMAAMYMLYKTQGDNFLQVLKWKAKNDPDLNVRRLAELLVTR
jgi:hypothetical protein